MYGVVDKPLLVQRLPGKKKSANVLKKKRMPVKIADAF